MSDVYEYPTLVSRYLSDGTMKAAVDSLVPRAMPKGLDPEFEWEEFPAYVEAWLAAQQVVAESCLAQASLWDGIWGAAMIELGAQPEYLPRRQSHDTLDNGGIAECWRDRWLSRHCRIGGLPISLYVFQGAQDYSIGIEFEQKLSASERRRLDLKAWNFSDYQVDSPDISLAIKADRVTLEIEPLRAFARQGIEALKRLEAISA